MKNLKRIIPMLFIFTLSTLLIAQSGLAQETWRERREEWREGFSQFKPQADIGLGGLTSYENINIIGNNPPWAYDISVEYDDDNNGWLAYSNADERGPEPGKLSIYLALTNDGGKTWTRANKIIQSRQEYVSSRLFTGTANVRHETPTLLYDPYDSNPDRRWKLFWVIGIARPGELGGYNKDTIWLYTQIGYKYASSPEKLAEAKEIRLFGASGLNSCVSENCRVKYNLNNFHPDLKKSTFYMEPGSLVKDGTIYLTLTAASILGLQQTILLSSSDHAQTWNYAGRLTGKDTLTKETDKNYTPNQTLLTSSALAEENGRIFLLASPRTRKIPGEYSGIYIFEFEDIAKAKLKRNRKGRIIVHKYLPAIDSRVLGGGQSEYHEKNIYGGIIMSQTDNSKLGSPEFFKIFSTKEKICK